MIDKCEIAEFLIKHAKEHVTNGSTLSYPEIDNKFGDIPMLWRVIESTEHLITNNNKYEYNGDDIEPQYTVMVKKENGFPGDGFFNGFRTINRQAYNKITNKSNTLTLTDKEKREIVAISTNILIQEINSKFIEEDDILELVMEMRYEGKC